MVDFVLNILGIPYLRPITFWFMVGIAFAVSVASGWIADAIMGNLSFGIALNALILITGAVLTLFGWRYFNMPLNGHFVYVFILALGFVPSCILLLSVFLRRFI